jgi:hypothetical protein
MLLVNQIGKTIEPAKAKPVASRCFERRFCGVLIALIFAAVVIMSLVLTHLPGRVAIDSANGAGQGSQGHYSERR